MNQLKIMMLHSALDAVEAPLGLELPERIDWLIAAYQNQLDRANQEKPRPPRDNLLASLDENRWEALLLLADTCLDDGLELEAQGWGWLATYRKWPGHVIDLGWLFWAADSKATAKICFMIPDDLLQSTTSGNLIDSPGTVTYKQWPSARAALEAVVEAIAAGRWSA